LRGGHGRGRARARRRRRSRPAGLLRRADSIRRHDERDADQPRGDLRPRGRRHPRRRRGGGGAHRERHPLRPRGGGVDPRRVARAPDRQSAERRNRVDQQLRRARRLLRVRWTGALGLRLRAGTADDRGVHDAEDREANVVSTLAELDAAHVLHPHAVVGSPAAPVIWARGRGATLWDVDGKEYVDGTCGLWQCAVGHGRPELARAAAEQIERLEFYASFWNFANEPSIRLATRLAELSPPGLDRVFFTNGGSEGIETAIKLVRLAWHAQGQPERNVILSRKSAYHGVGVASLAATGIPPLKEGFGPLAPGFVHLSTPTQTAAADALVAELGGMIPPPDGYWPQVQQVLREHGILLVLDEIVTGYGRTGHWFGAQRYELDA